MDTFAQLFSMSILHAQKVEVNRGLNLDFCQRGDESNNQFNHYYYNKAMLRKENLLVFIERGRESAGILADLVWYKLR